MILWKTFASPSEETKMVLVGIGVYLGTLLAGVLTVYASAKGLRQVVHLWRTPGLDGVAGQGSHVVVEGTAEPADETLTSPRSDTECVAYKTHTRTRKKRSSPNSDSSVSRGRSSASGTAVPFDLVTTEGRLHVTATEAELYLPMMEREKRGRRTVQEYALKPGDDVFVYGRFDTSGAAESDRIGTITGGGRLTLPVITTKPPSSLVRTKAVGFLFFGAMGTVCLGIFAYVTLVLLVEFGGLNLL